MKSWNFTFNWKLENIMELTQVLNAPMLILNAPKNIKQYMKSISKQSPKYNKVLLC